MKIFIFMTITLNPLSGRLLISISLWSLPEVFVSFFHLVHILLFLTLPDSLCLPLFLRCKSYFSQTQRSALCQRWPVGPRSTVPPCSKSQILKGHLLCGLSPPTSCGRAAGVAWGERVFTQPAVAQLQNCGEEGICRLSVTWLQYGRVGGTHLC